MIRFSTCHDSHVFLTILYTYVYIYTYPESKETRAQYQLQCCHDNPRIMNGKDYCAIGAQDPESRVGPCSDLCQLNCPQKRGGFCKQTGEGIHCHCHC